MADKQNIQSLFGQMAALFGKMSQQLNRSEEVEEICTVADASGTDNNTLTSSNPISAEITASDICAPKLGMTDFAPLTAALQLVQRKSAHETTGLRHQESKGLISAPSVSSRASRTPDRRSRAVTNRATTPADRPSTPMPQSRSPSSDSSQERLRIVSRSPSKAPMRPDMAKKQSVVETFKHALQEAPVGLNKLLCWKTKNASHEQFFRMAEDLPVAQYGDNRGSPKSLELAKTAYCKRRDDFAGLIHVLPPFQTKM